MARSPAHQWGQIIGEVIETTVAPFLEEFAQKQGLYLDKKGPRIARTGSKVTWVDRNGNKHDLDFVLEKDGTYTRKGIPVAFIETAWRRYTKHSRNKAQEIQGAVIPLAETYKDSISFVGAILAGVFTGHSLQQLESLGFTLLYFSYTSVVEAFGVVGIDATFGEDTPDSEFEQKIHQWEELAGRDREKIMTALVQINAQDIDDFMEKLSDAVTRQIELVRILPLYGVTADWASVEEAINFIKNYKEDQSGELPLVRYEVEIRYVNSARVLGEFPNKAQAIEFLQKFGYPPPPLHLPTNRD